MDKKENDYIELTSDFDSNFADKKSSEIIDKTNICATYECIHNISELMKKLNSRASSRH